MAVLAYPGCSAEELPPVTDRKFLDIDIDVNSNERMSHCAARMLAVPNTLTGKGCVGFGRYHAGKIWITFRLAQIARGAADALNQLPEARTQLANLQTYMDGKRQSGKSGHQIRCRTRLC